MAVENHTESIGLESDSNLQRDSEPDRLLEWLDKTLLVEEVDLTPEVDGKCLRDFVISKLDHENVVELITNRNRTNWREKEINLDWCHLAHLRCWNNLSEYDCRYPRRWSELSEGSCGRWWSLCASSQSSEAFDCWCPDLKHLTRNREARR